MKSSIFVKKKTFAAADVVWVAAQFRLFIMIITAHTHTHKSLPWNFICCFIFPTFFPPCFPSPGGVYRLDWDELDTCTKQETAGYYIFCVTLFMFFSLRIFCRSFDFFVKTFLIFKKKNSVRDWRSELLNSSHRHTMERRLENEIRSLEKKKWELLLLLLRE